MKAPSVRTVAVWLSGGMTVLLAAVWFASYFRYLNVTICGRWGCDVFCGQCRCGDFLGWYGTGSPWMGTIASLKTLNFRTGPLPPAVATLHWAFAWDNVLAMFPAWVPTVAALAISMSGLFYVRLRRHMKWSAIGVAVSLAVSWIASGWLSIRYQQGIFAQYSLECGRVCFVDQFMEEFNGWREHDDDYEGWHVSRITQVGPQFVFTNEWKQTSFAIQLWPLVLVMCGIAALLWRADAIATRRIRDGKCGTCGYDRKGIAQNAKCPECGTPAKRAGTGATV